MPMEDVKPTVKTIGNYELLSTIAEGGMGTVYRGRSQQTGEIVAVKVMPRHLLSNAVYLRRFEQEYFAARALDHPNVVKAIDYGRDGTIPYLVMEFVEGESLGQRVEREGGIPEAAAIGLIRQVAEGLQKAHDSGLIHRDVKPDNILVTKDGVAKLTDLGLVKELDADLNLTRTGRGLGTPHFMAPEQFRNAKKADVRCDIYSLAATLYMLVTGELPFRSNGPLDAWMKKVNNELIPPRELAPHLSERVDWAIRRAMSPEPAQRPESCRAFIEDLIGQGTQHMLGTDPSVDGTQMWHVLYEDDGGATRTLHATTATLRRSLEEGRLGDAESVRIASKASGPFQPLRRHPEFKDIETPAPESEPEPTPLAGPFEAVTPGPHIHLAAARDGRSLLDEVWRWLAVTIIVGSAGTLGYYLLPLASRWRWF